MFRAAVILCLGGLLFAVPMALMSPLVFNPGGGPDANEPLFAFLVAWPFACLLGPVFAARFRRTGENATAWACLAPALLMNLAALVVSNTQGGAPAPDGLVVELAAEPAPGGA